MTLLREELTRQAQVIDELARTLRRLQDSPLIKSHIDGAPRIPFPAVFVSPLTGQRYVLLREVTTGHAAFHELTAADPAPHPSDWSDA